MSIIAKIKENPVAKRRALWMLMPANEPRPRWWVRNILNRFYHKRGKAVTIRSSVRRDVLPFHKFEVGDGCVIEDYSVVNNGMGDVFIGEGSFIGLYNVIIGPVTIGRNVIFAQNVVLSGLNHGYEDISMPIKDQKCTVAEIVVGDDSWIGANAVITAGVTLGKHVVVAGGSVVTKSFPDYCIVAGNPARMIKKYDKETKAWKRT